MRIFGFFTPPHLAFILIIVRVLKPNVVRSKINQTVKPSVTQSTILLSLPFVLLCRALPCTVAFFLSWIHSTPGRMVGSSALGKLYAAHLRTKLWPNQRAIHSEIFENPLNGSQMTRSLFGDYYECRSRRRIIFVQRVESYLRTPIAAPIESTDFGTFFTE